MAEIRIPTDQIPLDILHRLQAMIPSLNPSFLQTNAFGNQTQSQGEGYNTPGNKSSPTQCTPSFEKSHTAAAPSVTLQTYARSRGANWSPHHKHLSTTADEVDGDDTIVHAFHIQPPTAKVAHEVLDDSDIVRIFPKVGEGKTTSHNGSDVVRIFESGPDGVKRMADTTGIIRIDQDSASEAARETSKSDIVRVLSPVSAAQSNMAHANSKADLTQQRPVANSRTDTTESLFRSALNSSPWGDASASQHDRISLPFTGNRRHSSSVMPTSADIADRRANTPEQRVGMPAKGPSHNFHLLQSQISREGLASSPALPEKDGSRIRQGYAEMGTCVQTVEDAEVEDDEVFSLDVGSKQCGFDAHKPCHHDVTNQHIFETTPIRDLIVPRVNPEICEPMKNRLSPFSPALMLSEMSFGDRQNTRKRLSFEEGEASPPKSQFKFPSCITQQGFQSIPFSSAALTPPSTPKVYTSNKSLSPFLSSQKHVFTYPYSQCSSPDREILSSPSSDICQKPAERSSSSLCRSPVSEMMQVLEQVSSQHVQGSGSTRCRVRSDGDEGFLESAGRSHCHPQQPRPRGQTFSHSKRRRKNSSYSGDDEDSSSGSQESLTRPQDQVEEACGDCQCSMIKKYVLQMAENAYKRIRKMDGSVEDFERFRTELATTNNLLRESIANIYSFKTICPHKSRSSSSSSSSSLQSSNRPS